ncbi:glycosyltransferase [Burkholderiaceae bacterium]|nr:glycosyltransferase [Burkholderiaceae bacterium]
MIESFGDSASRPRVSIVTSVFNNSTEIRSAVESVLSQRGVNIEFIVVDGGSTDGTLVILESYGKRIHKLISGPDLGIYDGLNRGIGLATGDYVGFLHSDDLFADAQTLQRLFARVSKLDCS